VGRSMSIVLKLGDIAKPRYISYGIDHYQKLLHKNDTQYDTSSTTFVVVDQGSVTIPELPDNINWTVRVRMSCDYAITTNPAYGGQLRLTLSTNVQTFDYSSSTWTTKYVENTYSPPSIPASIDWKREHRAGNSSAKSSVKNLRIEMWIKGTYSSITPQNQQASLLFLKRLIVYPSPSSTNPSIIYIDNFMIRNDSTTAYKQIEFDEPLPFFSLKLFSGDKFEAIILIV
jgi:hypothetical protein